MRDLSLEELKDVKGGEGITLGTISLIVLGATFIIGVIDGYVRPLKCN